MFPISPVYSDYLRRRAREWIVHVEIDGVSYGTDVIVNFELENSVADQNDFTIGTAILSKLVLTLRTPEEMPVNARVVPYLALSLAGMRWIDAVYPWQDADFTWSGTGTSSMPLGEFYIDKRQRVNNVWTYTCYDKLTYANAPYISSLTYPATQKAVWDEICSRLGYTYDSSVVINPGYMVPVAPTGYSMRQVLGYIAGCNSASVFIGKDGTVKFRRYAAADNPVMSITEADYTRLRQTNPLRTITRVEVTYNTDDGLVYAAGTGNESQTLQIVNPLATQQIVNDIHARINGFSFTPVEIDARGYPQIEVGDRIAYERYEGQSWVNSIKPWQDTHIPWNGLVGYQTVVTVLRYRFTGGLNMTMVAPSKSEQASEFPVEGSLSGQINKLNKDAVRESRKYFGVTINRNNGLIIERDDHWSRVVLNSDELTFYADGSRAIWFDVPSKRYKFNGTLDAVDGVFSGSLSAATGTFAGDLSAAGGTFKGNLTAAGGTFKGDLQAAGGTFKGALQAATGTFGGVYTGILYANQIDVSQGKIQTAQIEDLVVGGNVTMGPNASINWPQINQVPNNVYNPDYIKSTYIDSTNVIAPNITGGVLTGAKIQTGPASSYPRIELNSSANLLEAQATATGGKLQITPTVSGAIPGIQMQNDSTLAMMGNLQAGKFLINTVFGLGDIQIRSGNNLELFADNQVIVNSWSKFTSASNSKNLQQEFNEIWTGINGRAPAFTGANNIISVVTNIVNDNPVYAIFYINNGIVTTVVT